MALTSILIALAAPSRGRFSFLVILTINDSNILDPTIMIAEKGKHLVLIE